jgi:hypothetical protein
LVHALQATGQTAYYIDYEDILDLDVLNGLASFLGVKGRLAKLDFRFKKQNPQAIAEKVSNPLEMRDGLAKIDWFNQSHIPNFQPRRLAAVPQYVASGVAPLLFMPIKSAPEGQIKKWLQSFGPLADGFDRQSLRVWKGSHPGQRSFAVLRHPLKRAYASYCSYVKKEWMPELRPYLKRVHKFQMPPKGQPFETEAEFRVGFVVFLELLRHVLDGRTELRVLPQIASQGALIQGFAQLQSPDMLIREDRLVEGLGFLAADVGVAAHPLPSSSDNPPYELASIYAADLEDLARKAYWRDYEGFGFTDWKP